MIGARVLEGMPSKGLTRIHLILLAAILSTFRCICLHEPSMDPRDHLTLESREPALPFVYSAG